MAVLARPTRRPGPPAAAAPAPDRAPDWVASGTPEPLRSELIAALGEDRVLTRALDLVKYASDASPYRLIPQAIAMPRDVDDVVKLMAFATRTRTPLTFRAGGTSLNGQAQSDAVLVDVRRHWQRIWIEDGGERVRAQPGIVLGHVNRRLARYARKLGPDPASTDIACVGGVIANNSGGMRCGTHADPYRTVRSMTFVLADGTVIDTAAPGAGERFVAAAPELARGLVELRDELRGDAALAERVRRKFAIKNTTGYRLCALLDADEPLEIFRRLIVGSEGTLACVAEAVLDTVALGRHTTTALLLFPTIDAAAAAVAPLVDGGASATELMVAPTLTAAAHVMPGTPAGWKQLPKEAAALLVEFRDDEERRLDDRERDALALLASHELLEPAAFSRDAHEIEMRWRVREGMAAMLAEMRPPGASLIIEDVCVPPARIAEMGHDLPELLAEHGYPSGIAGHASVGNLHFLLPTNFSESADLERYEAFMNDLVELIVAKYDGSLKAEHGTGRNMAPFVEREWGPKATEMMWRIKELADPDGILAPGVVLNHDHGVHLRDLKSAPEIEATATKCIECGFCEPVCPSRHVTTTPRQRIVLRREMARQPAGSPVLAALLDQYEYDAIETCAADGSCGPACPLGIDTGKLVKQLRRREHGERAERVAVAVAQHYGVVERGARVALRAAGATARVGGERALAAATGALRQVLGAEVVPAWTEATPPAAPGRLPFTLRDGAAAVYLPACINRIFGNPSGRPAHPTLPEALVALSQRAGLPVWIPADAGGHCCGMPWSSKGYERGHGVIEERMRGAMARWTEGGRLPVVLDASSCSHALRDELRLDGVTVLDSIEWVHDRLLDRLEIPRRLGSVVLHPTCSASHLGLVPKLTEIASRIAEEVVIPAGTTCCGMAGDRGWLHPELPASALRDVAAELDGRSFDACVSSNRTCEVALQRITNRSYASFVLALEELTRRPPVSGAPAPAP
ncbi:MAG: FAD-binding oxidoreductase [Solirubrobacterales bacterium]|nr:FAD-binding oxidoreductase [Solirubrobacterales bacterium]MBV9713892.1 FAD-binding oxidoreductase [Solirubrobacterales bacterium]